MKRPRAPVCMGTYHPGDSIALRRLVMRYRKRKLKSAYVMTITQITHFCCAGIRPGRERVTVWAR